MKLICTLLAISLSLSVMAKPVLKEGLFVFDGQKNYLQLFQNQSELTIDLVSKEGYELYGPEGLTEWLDDLGVLYSSLETKGRYGYYDEYPTTADNEEKLKDLAARYPFILELSNLGTTSQGRIIWAMKISDNVEIDEVEPEFKYIANMHGNEITGREMMMELIEDLAVKYYEGDPRVTKLINNTEIYIVPTMNPDGSDLHRRSNGNWADLNRDFPDFIDDPVNTHDGRELETIAIMDFQASRHFALSANLHDGATVVNYPWDSTLNRFPFDNLIKNLSKEYASIVPGMYNSTSFTDGITNGADWYVIHGGMQDWSYFWHGDMQITLEISLNKWPSYEATMNFYEQHHESLVTYMERVHQGAGFKFEETNVEGVVKIYNADSKAFLGQYGFDSSEFYKVLEPGNYRFVVRPEGFDESEIIVTVDQEVSDADGNYTTI